MKRQPATVGRYSNTIDRALSVNRPAFGNRISIIALPRRCPDWMFRTGITYVPLLGQHH